MSDPQIAGLTPPQLRQVAKAHAKQSAQTGHWVKIASIIGRVVDEKLWEQFEDGAAQFGDAATWCEEEMGLARAEFVQYLDLWELMKKGAAQTPAMPVEHWYAVKKSTAVVLKKIAAADGNLKTWRDQVASLPVETARIQIETALGGKELWTTLRVRIPVEMEPLIEHALAYVAERHPELGITGEWMHAKNGFRLLEALVVEYAQLVDGAGTPSGARYRPPIARVPIAQ